MFYSKRPPPECKLSKVQKIDGDLEESAYAARVDELYWIAFAARVGACEVWWVRRETRSGIADTGYSRRRFRRASRKREEVADGTVKSASSWGINEVGNTPKWSYRVPSSAMIKFAYGEQAFDIVSCVMAGGKM